MPPMASDGDGIDGQRRHWRSTFEANPTMYGTQPSEPGPPCGGVVSGRGFAMSPSSARGRARHLAFLHAGMSVTASITPTKGSPNSAKPPPQQAWGQADHDRQRRT